MIDCPVEDTTFRSADRSGFLNLFPHLSLENGNTLVQGDFIISGTSSQKAAEEASAVDISVHSVLGNRSFPNKSLYRFNSDTFRDALCFSPFSKFIYFCQNEIIQGFKVPYQIIPEQAFFDCHNTRKLVI